MSAFHPRRNWGQRDRIKRHRPQRLLEPASTHSPQRGLLVPLSPAPSSPGPQEWLPGRLERPGVACPAQVSACPAQQPDDSGSAARAQGPEGVCGPARPGRGHSPLGPTGRGWRQTGREGDRERCWGEKNREIDHWVLCLEVPEVKQRLNAPFHFHAPAQGLAHRRFCTHDTMEEH